MQKRFYVVLMALVVISLLVAACGGQSATPAPTVAPVVEQPTTAPVVEQPTAEPAQAAFTVGQVTDVGGIDDKSFNQTAWAGVQRAVEELGVEGVFLESQQQTDYEKNLNEFISQGKDLIITVGFLLADATKAAAEANPDSKFAIIDSGTSAAERQGPALRHQPAFLPGRLPGRGHERDRHGLYLRRPATSRR
ncbi:MAG: BMP family ABC transporter substrate-binding protein [Anaerolineae bacterium]